MAILYDWYENPGTNEEAPEERGLHPRPLLNGKVTMRQLYNRVHARSSLTVGDVMNAIDCLTQICGEELRDGHEVHIEGLGYFAPTLEATQKVTRSTSISGWCGRYITIHCIRSQNIRFNKKSTEEQ